jgi:hypothetical protein
VDALTSNFVISRAKGNRLILGLNSGLWTLSENESKCKRASPQPLPGGLITSIVQAGSNPTALLVSGYDSMGVPTVMKSIDDGTSFQVVQELSGVELFEAWSLSSSPNLDLAIAVAGGSTIAVSKDGGTHWTIQPDTFSSITAGASVVSATQGKVFFSDISGALYAAPNDGLQP